MTAEAQTAPETGEVEDDADRRAKGVMAHHLEYGPLAMQRTIAETIRSAVDAEKERCATLCEQAGMQAAELVAAAIRARGAGS